MNGVAGALAREICDEQIQDRALHGIPVEPRHEFALTQNLANVISDGLFATLPLINPQRERRKRLRDRQFLAAGT